MHRVAKEARPAPFGAAALRVGNCTDVGVVDLFLEERAVNFAKVGLYEEPTGLARQGAVAFALVQVLYPAFFCLHSSLTRPAKGV